MTNDLNGFLLLNKAKGLSSNQALQQVKKLFGAKKAGHTGSLDPLASGMLPIAFGEATKFCEYLLSANKHYSVIAKLGEKTDTGDAEGEVIARKKVSPLDKAKIEKALNQFIGDIEQIPPMYSAIKYKGQPLYKLARQGITVERKKRMLNIQKFNFIAYNNEQLSCEVRCSKGTYIRTLMEDVAETLNTYAHLSFLQRNGVSPFEKDKMYTYNELVELEEEKLPACILPIDSALIGLPKLKLTEQQSVWMQQGRAFEYDIEKYTGHVRLYNTTDEFIGMGILMEQGLLKAKRMLSNN